MISRCLEPFMYLKIVFTASVSWWLGFLAKRLATDMAKAMSGLVSTMENIRDPVIPWYRSLSDGEASPSVLCSRGVAFFIDVLTEWALSRWNLARTLSMHAGWDNLMVFSCRFRSTLSYVCGYGGFWRCSFGGTYADIVSGAESSF